MEYILIFISAIFVNNIVLSQFLGICPFLGVSKKIDTALGMAAVFCGVTNCPLTTLLVSFELFGFAGIPYFMIVISVSYMLSGYRGLYSDQIIVYSKYRPQFINRHVGDDAEDDLTD